MTVQTPIIPRTGDAIEVPLGKLKKSPRNARTTPHRPEDVEALAASILAKGLLQPLVVEPQAGPDGEPTGAYLVTIGEGRRLAHALLAKRKQIAKGHKVRCLVDTANDAHEISLDENVTRFAMHPADQFEAFRRLADERGWGAEEIAARFGVTPAIVRQRLRLASVSPILMRLYRKGEMSLEQLMAFAITEDHERQETAWRNLGWSREPYTIRRMLTEDRISSRDKRALFVGAAAYEAAGGLIERDLFAEDGGGYFAYPALLERLALERLEEAALAERKAGWAWAEASIDYPAAHGLRRVYPKERASSSDEEARLSALGAEYDVPSAQWDDADEVPPEVSEELDALQQAIDSVAEARFAYAPEDVARSGVFVVLGHDGAVRFERGFVRPQDEPPAVEDEAGRPDAESCDPRAGAKAAGLPKKLAVELTAHRTAALRVTVGDNPAIAMMALTHAMVLQSFFFGYDLGSCLDLRLTSVGLAEHIEGYAETLAARRLEARHFRWAARLPDEPAEVWSVLATWTDADRLAILGHCVSLAVNAVRSEERQANAFAHADVLALATSLDMTEFWTPTADSYLARVTRGFILEAVREARSPAEASRLEQLKKPDMAAEAERLLADRRWLPPLLRAAEQAAV